MIYRVIRKLKAVLYHAIVGPDIKHSFAECGKDSHIESGGDFFPLSNIHIGNHASIGVNARFWTTRAQIYKDVAPYRCILLSNYYILCLWDHNGSIDRAANRNISKHIAVY